MSGDQSAGGGAAAAAGAESNTWAALLKKAAGAKKEEDFTLVVLGDVGAGKTQLLGRFKERHCNEKSVEYLVDYSYLNVKNVHDEQDADEVRARGKVVELSHPEQAASLLPFLLRGAGLATVCYVVCVDLSRPWDIQAALDRWLGVLNKAHAEVFTDLPEEEQRSLMERVSRYNQFYVDPSTRAAEESEAAPPAPASAARGSVLDVPVDTTQPARNLGVPLVLVGTQADKLMDVFATQEGVGDRFEYISRRLRAAALEYGAGLVFTSAGTPEPINVAALQEYVYHRVYGFKHARGAKVVGSDTDYGLYVPSGYDSQELIESVKPARSGWSDGAGFEEVFQRPDSSPSASNSHHSGLAAAAEAEAEVKAEANDVFFKTLKFTMSSSSQPQPVRTAGTAKVGASAASPVGGASAAGGGAANGDKARTRTAAAKSRGDNASGTAVKSFFKNLLANKSGGIKDTDRDKLRKDVLKK